MIIELTRVSMYKDGESVFASDIDRIPDKTQKTYQWLIKLHDISVFKYSLKQ